jgi:hypothetical protein
MSYDSNTGNIYVSLFSYSTNMNHGKKDGVVLKLDPNAKLIWANHYGAEEEDGFTDVTNDGAAAYLNGHTNSKNLTNGISNILVVKVDSMTGNLLW